MKYFLNLRAGSYGAVCEPYVIAGDIAAGAPLMKSVPFEAVPALVKGKNVLLATHGFNVGYQEGLLSLGRFSQSLAPSENEFILGILWPGDWVIPAVNYPFEEKIAAHAGKLVGGFCNRWLTGAGNLSFVSHSLGARVVLEAAGGLNRKVRTLCITAGAIGADCLTASYRTAAANCDAIVTLSSMEDMVLAMAFPVGDLIADILDLDHKPFERALGRRGPEVPYGPTVAPSQIPDSADYGHGDYLPPSARSASFPDPAARWSKAVAFMGRAFRRQPQNWPS